MIFVFLFLIFLLFYTYLGYPFLLPLLHHFLKAKPVGKQSDYMPLVSLVVPAYNEAASIRSKIENILALDYPANKKEIVVVSDCSSDGTDDIVREFASSGVRLHRMEVRGGKIAGYLSVLPTLRSEIVVFSDATSYLERKSLTVLMSNFADETVGCVGGRLRYLDPQKAEIAKGEQTYWDYETRIKRWESDIISLTSVSGTFYALRKECFPMNMAKDLADDLIVVLATVKCGKRVIFEPDASCSEYAIHADDAEVTKRSRIAAQNIRGLLSMPELLNIFCYGKYSFLLISHKVLRQLSPLFLILLFFVNAFLLPSGIFWQVFFFLQVIFYGLGIVGASCKQRRPKILNIVYYFCLSNFAIFLGIVKFFQGHRHATWETAR